MCAEAEADYRAELEQVLTYFGDKRVLNVKEVARYTGKSGPWCKKMFGVGRNNAISATQFARLLSKL